MATPLTETDIFRFYEDSGANMTGRIKAIVTNPNAASIVNERMEHTLTKFGQTFKEPIVMKTISAIRNGDLVLFIAQPAYNLPECLPFFRYTMKGKVKVAVNLTNIVNIDATTEDSDSVMIDDMRKMYALLIGAYLCLSEYGADHMPIKAIENGAIMWARMFCKVLNRTIGLATNKERYETYFYFAVRYFLINLIGAPMATVDSISKALLKSGQKTPLIINMEAKIDELGLDMYKTFTGFCDALFNNDISNIKGMRLMAANPNEKLNVSFYLRQFVNSYTQSAVLGLANVNYFTWMVLCTYKKAYMMNIKMLDDVMTNNEAARYLSQLYSWSNV